MDTLDFSRIFLLSLLLPLILIANMPIYGQTKPRTDEDIELLLADMTLEEKIGQMAQITMSEILDEESKSAWEQLPQSFGIDPEKLEAFMAPYYIGSYLNGYAVEAETWIDFITRLQQANMASHPHQIPIIFGIDHIHGATYVKDATIFPQAITLAASFDPELARIMGEVTVHESAHLGHHWVFNPVLGLARNKYWSRMHETYGEDPYLSAQMGAAYIRGVQDGATQADIQATACAKHFLGYSDPVTGRDRSPAMIAPQALQEVFVPPFQAAIDAGVKTVMINSGEINGVPAHASGEILTDLLRTQMGFKGVAITDWEDIISLHMVHRVAPTEKEAVYVAIQAGVDMSMVPYSVSFCDHLLALVKEGRISEERIDLSTRRILKLKMDLGLFEHPYPKTGRPMPIRDNRVHARKAAEESLVLLRNEGEVLPLKPDQKVLLVGSTSHSKRALTGGWTYLWGHKDDRAFPEEMQTIQQAMIAELGEERVQMADLDDIAEKAHTADVICVAAGENIAYSEGFNNMLDLDLPPRDMLLLEAAIQTAKPVVLILVEGRPRTFPKWADQIGVMLFAGLPGYYGADVIVDVLTGKVNPSGKLAFTYPYHQAFQLTYDHKLSNFTWLHTNSPEIERYALAEFGQGVSYTTFAYKNLTLSSSILKGESEKLRAEITLTNTGNRTGKETVLWFIKDEYGHYTRPVKALRHFEKVQLDPGESRVCSFEIDPISHLSYPDAEGKRLLEAGTFSLMVGSLSEGFVWEE